MSSTIFIPRKPADKNQLMAFVYCENDKTIDIERLLDELKNKWSLEAEDAWGQAFNFEKTMELQAKYGTLENIEELVKKEGWDPSVLVDEDSTDYTMVCLNLGDQGEEIITVSLLPKSIHFADMVEQSPYNSLHWDNVEAEFNQHQSYLLVTFISAYQIGRPQYELFTKVVAAIVESTHAIGVYQTAQHQFVSKEGYIREAQALLNDDYPINLWVPIAVVEKETGMGLYTQGFDFMGRLEIEMFTVGDNLMSAIMAMKSVIAYLVVNDLIIMESGGALVYENQRIDIEVSPAVFLVGDTVKLNLA